MVAIAHQGSGELAAVTKNRKFGKKSLKNYLL
jgi:hypothetical protein